MNRPRVQAAFCSTFPPSCGLYDFSLASRHLAARMLLTQAAREGRAQPRPSTSRSANARRQKPVTGKENPSALKSCAGSIPAARTQFKSYLTIFALDTESHEFHQPRPIFRSIDEGPRTELRHRALLGAPCKRPALVGPHMRAA